jgi:hypothetical protein
MKFPVVLALGNGTVRKLVFIVDVDVLCTIPTIAFAPCDGANTAAANARPNTRSTIRPKTGLRYSKDCLKRVTNVKGLREVSAPLSAEFYFLSY